MELLIPESAPFTAEQRVWLNGFIAGLLGAERMLAAGGAAQALAPAADGQGAAMLLPGMHAAAGQAAQPVEDEGDFPWHDPALGLGERMKLADTRPLPLQLMAAMGQLDCGQCGYLCQSYAAAIAGGAESDLSKCVPGGRPTAKKLKELIERAGTAVRAPAAAPRVEAPAPAPRGYGRDVPVKARLAFSVPLCTPLAEKETRHVVVDITGSELTYAPGDSLGVWARNNPEEVELLLAILKAKGSEAVTLGPGTVVPAREALSTACDLRVPSEELYRLLAREAKSDVDRARLAKLAEDDALAESLGVHDVLDVVLEFPSARPRIGEFTAALGRMQPRLYSIASSQRMHPTQVHLTVGVLRYEKNERLYQGTGSSFVAEHLRPGRPLSVFIQRAHAFSLPADPAAPVIMVGPGTGIAPFRAFLQEREAARAPGRNWLFFGNQRRETDFLYRDELEAFAQNRVLTRMDLAFSRDQTSKVYVQHKMLEAGEELWRWLQNGACIYVCGDAKRMAGDVNLALREIAVTHGGMDTAAATRYFADLARSGRYQRDVY
jgi:sulfite reductase (NADPH) flavoprotein alpha-component